MSIYEHFRPDEKEFIDRVLQWADQVEKSYTPRLSDFLDPREQVLVNQIIGNHSIIKYTFFGGYDHAERKRALFYPQYDSVKEDDFKLALLEVHYPQKFVSLEHRQVLGSLMSLGITRGKYGDIIIAGERIQFFCAQEIAAYIQMQLTSIGKASVTLKETPLINVLPVHIEWTEDQATTSSLRLDTLISAIYHLSRQKSQQLISQGNVKVNWMAVERQDFDCKKGDVFSVRGFGRAKLLAIEGKTKKEKWRIITGKQK
ncbi:RNA-binding protein [Bacillaceae bacterium Marseille-Q3522]|nr:RNA-binding protein [Bacillaceae bacterium Marseille-Q3522]